MEEQQLCLEIHSVDAPWLSSSALVSFRISVENRNYTIFLNEKLQLQPSAVQPDKRIHLLIQAGNIVLGSKSLVFEKMFGSGLDQGMSEWLRFEVPGEVVRYIVKEDIGKQSLNVQVTAKIENRVGIDEESPQKPPMMLEEAPPEQVKYVELRSATEESDVASEGPVQSLGEETGVVEDDIENDTGNHIEGNTAAQERDPFTEEEQSIENSPVSISDDPVFNTDQQESPLSTIISLQSHRPVIEDSPECQDPLPTPSPCTYINKLQSVESYQAADSKTLENLRTELGTAFMKLIEEGTRHRTRSPTSPASKLPISKRTHSERSLSNLITVEVTGNTPCSLENINTSTSATLISSLVGLATKRGLADALRVLIGAAQKLTVQQVNNISTLQAAMKETEYQSFSEEEKFQEFNREIQEEIAKTQKEINSQEQQNALLETQRDEIRSIFENLHRKTECQQDCESLREEALKLKQLFKETQQEKLDSITSLDLAQELKNITRTSTALAGDKSASLAQLNKEQCALDQLVSENLKLKEALTRLQSKSLAEQNSFAKEAHGTSLQSLESEALKLRILRDNNTQTTHQLFKQLQQHIASNKQFTIDSAATLELHTNSISSMKSGVQQLEFYIKQLNEIYRSKRSVDSICKLAQKRILDSRGLSSTLSAELNYLADRQLLNSSNTLTVARLLKLLWLVTAEREDELCALKGAVKELKQRNPVYFPEPGDYIDVALGKQLNDRDEDLQVPFVRTRPGQYTFGTRKIIVSLERGKVTVKAGGGFLTLERFLSCYTHGEQGKQSGKYSPHARKALGKWAEAVVLSSDSSPEQMKDALTEAKGEHKFVATIGVTQRKLVN